MRSEELHDFLFQLYDYADYLADQIKPGNPDNESYFLTLIFIEKFFDRTGRSEVSKAAKESEGDELDSRKSLAEAHKRIQLLRGRIRALAQEYDFDKTLDRAGREIANEWRKRQIQDDPSTN